MTIRLPNISGMQGRWLPHTANHDFFESNYAITYSIVEFWNTVTALLVVYSGAICLVYSRGLFFVEKATLLPPAFWGLSILLFVIGVGSVIFHGTMKRWGQVLDELPMVYSALIFHWVLLDVANQPLLNVFRKNGNGRVLTGVFFCIALTLGTLVYFTHDFALFIVVYAICIAFLAARVRALVIQSEGQSLKASGSPQRRMAIQCITIYIGGFIFFWLPTEVLAAQLKLSCSDLVMQASGSEALTFWCGLRIDEYSLLQFTHSVFHLTSTMGTLAFVQFVAWQHYTTLGVPVRVHHCSLMLLGMDMVIPLPSTCGASKSE
jgi:hypothetical protein